MRVVFYLNFAVPLDDPSIICACPSFAESPDSIALYLDERSRVEDCIAVLMEMCFTGAQPAQELAMVGVASLMATPYGMDVEKKVVERITTDNFNALPLPHKQKYVLFALSPAAS